VELLDSPAYYRLYRHPVEGPVVVCMQWFDEWDYEAEWFLGDEEYTTEAEAQEALKPFLREGMAEDLARLLFEEHQFHCEGSCGLDESFLETANEFLAKWGV
jgi:hypothetical protein